LSGGCVDDAGCDLARFWRIEFMIRIPFVLNLVALVSSLTARPIGTTGDLQAQASGTTGHEHLTEVACVDVPPGKKRLEFGCFNIGTVKELQFSQAAVYWHLHGFGSRKAAEASRSATGIVVEEDGRVWLSEFGGARRCAAWR
jgi:hypothetical protein